jgi:hypothetical protein
MAAEAKFFKIDVFLLELWLIIFAVSIARYHNGNHHYSSKLKCFGYSHNNTVTIMAQKQYTYPIQGKSALSGYG